MIGSKCYIGYQLLDAQEEWSSKAIISSPQYGIYVEKEPI